jgi:hypothetical protein
MLTGVFNVDVVLAIVVEADLCGGGSGGCGGGVDSSVEVADVPFRDQPVQLHL